MEFSSLKVAPEILTVISELGFAQMTPIQAQSIPLMLAGADLIGESKTGSGKTLAFAVPILEKVDIESRFAEALILCPTRELCAQVAREIRRLGRGFKGLHVLILSGGMPPKPQSLALQKGAPVIVGTPGRVLDHIQRGRLDLSRLKFLVLDEADRMLDMGFAEEMSVIMDEAPGTRQTVFFSATFPAAIKEMSQRYQHSPKHIVVEDPEAAAAPTIEQIAVEVRSREEKFDALVQVLKRFRPESAIVFCNLKVTVAELAADLTRHGIECLALHGDLEQSERDRVMAKFRSASTRVLVATDVAARGLDIADLPMVVNYDLPSQADVYVHRIGRTGRAGRSGIAVSLLSAEERFRLAMYEALVGVKMEPVRVADLEPGSSLSASERSPSMASGAAMEMLYISGGRKNKVRPGDILGALTGQPNGLAASDVGKIEIHDEFSYVAVSRSSTEAALKKLRSDGVKGKKFLVGRA